MKSPIEKLLGRVDSPKKGSKVGQYYAFCSHQVNRRERKLSITERTDGSLLLKCFIFKCFLFKYFLFKFTSIKDDFYKLY